MLSPMVLNKPMLTKYIRDLTPVPDHGVKVLLVK